MKNPCDRMKTARFWMVAAAALAMLIAASPAFAQKKPLKIFILAGQSNMQEPAGWNTLKGLADSPETKALYDKLVDEDGKVRIHKDVYIAMPKSVKDEDGNVTTTPVSGTLPQGFGGKQLGTELNPKPKKGEEVVKLRSKYGPELGFGATMHEELQEPILIIKAAWGGKSLCYHFRPPTGVDWVAPKGHPDHPDSAPKPLPIPTSIELPKDFNPPNRRGKNIQVGQGHAVGEINGIHPIYVHVGYGDMNGMVPSPFKKGDLILGLNGEGLRENPVGIWRDVFFNKVRKGDWMLTVTRWRDGKIETVKIDTSKKLKEGRAGIPAYIAAQKAAKKKLVNEGGPYYHLMVNYVNEVLKDPGKHHPAYDPKVGYEVAGFVWFQGFNDMIAGTTYPNSQKPRGYERYSWLLAHLIRNLRKEFKTPQMPVAIGVFGQGGVVDKPVPFREGMAAPASYPEFKDTVVAVRTAPFWDTRILEIQNKYNTVMAYDGGDPNHPYAKLQAKVKAYKEKMMAEVSKMPEGKARRRKEAAIRKGVIDVVRTPEEQEYLKNNVSERGFHYYGSPKFFVRAGDAFAKALAEKVKK